MSRTAPRRIRSASIWGTGIIATVAVAAVVVVWRARHYKSEEPSNLAELVSAIASSRPIQARLTGGFRWGPPPSPQRGNVGDRRVSPEVIIAAAHLQQQLRLRRKSETLSAYASAALVIGRVDEAVGALEEVTALDRSSRVLSDLSAAYLTRSQQAGHAVDVPRALETADTALSIDSGLPEAQFNRALALEAITLRRQAIAAWSRYVEIDRASPWSDEAKRHLEALRLEPDAKTFDVQAAREQVLDELLPNWARSVQQRLATAPDLLVRAKALTAQVNAASPDRFLADVLSAVEKHRTMADLIEGHAAFGRGRDQYRKSNHEAALTEFTTAVDLLSIAQSPLELLARLYSANCRFLLGRPGDAVPILQRLRRDLKGKGYDALIGRVEWSLGTITVSQGNEGPSIGHYTAAIQALHTARETSNEALVRTLQAQRFNAMGNQAQSWEMRLPALSLDRRAAALVSTAQAARDTDWPQTAADILDEALAEARTTGQAADVIDALRARALARARVGNHVGARVDLTEARQTATQSLPHWNRLTAELDASEAMCVDADHLSSGIDAATRAIRYFSDAKLDHRVPALLVARARLRRLQQDDQAALEDLKASLVALTRERSTIARFDLRSTYGDQIRKTADELVQLEFDHGRPDDAFLATQVQGFENIDQGSRPTGFSIASLQQLLSAHVVLMYFHVGDRELRVWTIRHERAALVRTPVDVPELKRLVELLNSGDNQPSVGRRLRALLLTPVEREWRDDDVLIIVPDAPLSLLSFSALPGRNRAFLIEEHALLVSPSLQLFIDASRRAAAFREPPREITAIGNPRIDRIAYPVLPELPTALEEARDIAGMYEKRSVLIGDAATPSAVIGALTTSEVVHFGGHAILNDLRPLESKLVVFDPSGRGVTAGDIEALRTTTTRLVVLAACDAASGLLTRTEGPVGIARALLTAEVPAVVASYWPVADRASRELFVRFHESFLKTGDPVASLQHAQVALARMGDPTLSSPSSWAGFVVIGGAGYALNAFRANEQSRQK